jgi:peptidoglycan/LPS O-acetylase OafA/YrhL
VPPAVLTPDAPAWPQVETSHARPALPYLGGIDGLRAVSVLAVLAYHGGLAWMPGGFLGVEVFFVISGYLITALLVTEQRRSGTVSLSGFWSRRARRLLPALYLVLTTAVVAALVGAPDALRRLRLDVPAALAYVSNWSQIVHHDSYFAQAGRPPLLSHLWSLAVEEQFYLFIPILALLLLPRLRRGALALVAVGGAAASTIAMAALYRPDVDPSHIYLATHTRLSGLLLGVAMGLVVSPWRLHSADRRAAPMARWALDAVGIAGLAVLGWAFWRVNEFDPFIYRGGFVVIDVATLAVLAAVVHPSSHFERILGSRVLVWLGRRSYGIYLWHYPIFQFTRPELDVRLGGAAVTALRLGLTLAVAALSYRFVEQPIRHGALTRRWAAEPAARRRDLNTALGAAVVLGLVLVIGPVARPDHSVDRLEAAARDAGSTDGAISLRDLVGSDRATTTITRPTTSTAPTTTAAPTTSVGAAVAATAAPTTVAPTTTVPAPTTTLAPAGIRVTAIGDSVMLDAKRNMQRQIPLIAVDARVSRQFGEAAPQAMRLAAFGALGPIVVVHLGTNGPMSEGQLHRLLGALGDRKVVLVTAHVPRPWEPLTNQRIRDAATRWPNVSVADWNALSASHPDWFVHDGTHLRPSGVVAYTELIRSSVQ